MEKKIYNSWAFSDNASEKSKINMQIYQEIKDKAVIECAGSGYGHSRYRVVSNPHNLSNLELALICDKGNLCFGHRVQGDLIIVHTD